MTGTNFMHPQGDELVGFASGAGDHGIPSPDATPSGMCTDGQLNLNGT